MRRRASLRAYLRQLRALALPALQTLPAWLDGARELLDADHVAAVWLDRLGKPDGCHAPDAGNDVCARLMAGAWPSGPSMGDLASVTAGHPLIGRWRAHLRGGERISTHWRRLGGQDASAGRSNPIVARRPAIGDTREVSSTVSILSALSGGARCADVLDACLVPGRCHDGSATCDGTGTRPSGLPWLLLVMRDADRAGFDARERTLFDGLAAELAAPAPAWALPSACHALATSVSDKASREGTVIWHAGQPEWLDHQAHALLRHGCQGYVDTRGPLATPVMHACGQVVEALDAHPEGGMAQGQDVAEAVVERCLDVPGGCLRLRAARLQCPLGHPSDRVRVLLRFSPPAELMLLQRLRDTPLSPLQREIALRLMCGQSREAVRAACGMGVQTLKTHLSSMRARLDPANDREILAGLAGALRSGKTTARLE